MQYIGWIPCINGHLDFGLMKIGIQGGFTNSESKDDNSIEVNFSRSKHRDSHERSIVLQSKVDWRDSSRFDEDSGKFRVIVTAEVNKSNSMDDRCLDGDLLIYPLSAEPESKEQRSKMNVHKLCHSIDEDEGSRLENFDLLEQITSGQEVVDNLSNFSCSIHFRVDPNGITRLQYNSNNLDLDGESLFIIARQAFYYLKYSLHTHKHHLAEQDSLTTITTICPNKECSEADAGLRLICQLKRELTSIKRIQNLDKKEHPTNNALGIISYIQSLISSLENSKIINTKIAIREQYRFKHINASFAAQNSKLSNEMSNSELVKSKAKVWLGFFLLSIWGCINFLFKSNDDNKAVIATDEFFTVISISIVFVLLVYSAIKRFYFARYSSVASKNLYDIKYTVIYAKIIGAALIAILLVIFGIVLN